MRPVVAAPGSDEATIGVRTVVLSLGSLYHRCHACAVPACEARAWSMVPRRLSPTGTTASSSGSEITQCRYSGDRNRAKVGEDERGAGPFLDFQRLYLASGVIDLDRCSRSPGNHPRLVSQDLPITKRLFAGGTYVNSGYCNPRTSRWAVVRSQLRAVGLIGAALAWSLRETVGLGAETGRDRI
jgi:hypothetical protein